MIEIRLEREEVTSGEEIRGEVGWNPPPGAKTPDALVVKVGWAVEGRAEFSLVARFEEKAAPSAPGALIRVPFAVSTEGGPVSYDGELVRVVWRVFATADIPWAIDPKKTAPFRVLPRRVPA